MLLVGGVILWGAVHSALASQPAKDAWAHLFGASPARFYRLGYNVFACVSFVPIAYMLLTFPDHTLYRAPSLLAGAMRVGQVIAAVALLNTLRHTDALSFAGVRQLIETERPSRLITHGLYRYVRHPLYTLGLLILWLQPSMTANTLAVFGAMTVYLLVGASLEERRLLREFGDAYRDYRQSTPMLLPRFASKERA